MTTLPRRLASLVFPGCALVLFAAPGCLIDDSSLSEENLFFCVADSDCTTTRHICDIGKGSCVVENTGPAGCIDDDEDGYGVGDDRIACREDAEDTDDTDADINPGAADLCDGKDNDSDGTSDEPLDCERISDCPTQNLPDSSFFRCESNLCILRPADTATAGCNISLNCTNAAYDEVPEACR